MKYTFNYKVEERQNPWSGIMSFQHFNGEKMYSDIVVRPENRMLETEPVECYPVAPDDGNLEYEILYSGTPDFTSTIYAPDLTQVPSFYYYAEDFTFANQSEFNLSGWSEEKYGENQFHFNLPNYSTGTYVYSLKVLTQAHLDSPACVPTHMDVYLKSPGYLNQVNLLDIDDTIYSIGLSFVEGNVSTFLLDFVFDFDSDMCEVYVTDLNGIRVLLTRNSIEWLRSYTAESSGKTYNTKELPIIIRFQIPPDIYDVNDYRYYLRFESYTYKKQLN